MEQLHHTLLKDFEEISRTISGLVDGLSRGKATKGTIAAGLEELSLQAQMLTETIEKAKLAQSGGDDWQRGSRPPLDTRSPC
jgi:hypothetical protein